MQPFNDYFRQDSLVTFWILSFPLSSSFISICLICAIPSSGRAWQQRLSLSADVAAAKSAFRSWLDTCIELCYALSLVSFFSCFHPCLCLSCAEENKVLLSAWVLLTVLKFQTRLKESLFLRLILLSSHTGGDPPAS